MYPAPIGPAAGMGDPKTKQAVAEKLAKPVEKAVEVTTELGQEAWQRTKQDVEKVSDRIEQIRHPGGGGETTATSADATAAAASGTGGTEAKPSSTTAEGQTGDAPSS